VSNLIFEIGAQIFRMGDPPQVATNLILMVVIVAIFLLAGAAVALLFFGYLAYLEDDVDSMWGPLVQSDTSDTTGADDD